MLGTEINLFLVFYSIFVTGFCNRKPAISEPVIPVIQGNRPNVTGSVIAGRLRHSLSPTPYNASVSARKPLDVGTPTSTNAPAHSTQQRNYARDSDA